ncbi:TPR_REGION domain-containing protein [Vibrio chagasii]|nr:TPR_REGION domain-containing protein [Vibrio chagasii]
MVNQEHSGPGDNVAGDKYENIIRSVQTRDLGSVIDNVMRDICYWELERATEKLEVLKGISALDQDVQLLLTALSVKVELVRGSETPSKNDLLTLLKYNDLPSNVWEVVTSILIDLESRTSENLARERYSDSKSTSFYIKEVYFEYLALKEDLESYYYNTKVYDLSEQELTGLVRGAIRVKNFEFAFELARQLDNYFSSANSKALLLYTESCLLVTQNQSKHYVSLSKQAKSDADRLVAQLLIEIAEKDDVRYIATLTNLLSLTFFLDGRLYDVAKQYVDKIRTMNSMHADFIEQLSNGGKVEEAKFELVSDSLDLEQFARLDSALENNQIKAKAVNKWVESGGEIRMGDDYINSFFDLYLRASVCPVNDKKQAQLLDERAQSFLDIDPDKFYRINPHAVLRLCEKFLELDLPLNAVKYLEPFLGDEAWVSPVFECYLSALYASEKFDLFLNKIKQLEIEDRTVSVCLREAQVYERLGEYGLSIQSARAAIDISPTNPYAWHLLLHVSRINGLSTGELKSIVFEIPEEIFESYDESKVALVNEIAIHIDVNLSDRVLVDWFVQNPHQVAVPLTQIHANALCARPKVGDNPYLPNKCGDGVTYSDGFDTFTRILVRDVDIKHPDLLDVESPLGQILEDVQVGDSAGHITVVQRLSPYVAAFRLAATMRSSSFDGTDVFRQFSLPSNQSEWIPYFENIMRRYSSEEKRRDEALQNPNVPLTMRGKYTDPSNPVRGAVSHFTSPSSTQYMGLFSDGQETPAKVIIDVYTAVYLSLIGVSSSFSKLGVEVVVTQHTKTVIEAWLKDVLRDDYMSMGVSETGLYRITADEIRRDTLGLIEGLQTILKYAKVETLKPVDTPDILVRIRDMIDETVYSTFQLSFANNVPLLCVDHLMSELLSRSGCPVANVNTLVSKLLNSLSIEERKKGIELNLFAGMPVSILYNDVIELSRSSDPEDTFLVFKFMEKYGETIDATGAPLSFLTDIVRNVTAVAYIDGAILAGGRAYNPCYDGYAEHVFNSCCRSAMRVVQGVTAEQRFAELIYSVIDTPSRVRKYVKLISVLASDFAMGHFLDFDACNEALASCHKNAVVKEQS